MKNFSKSCLVLLFLGAAATLGSAQDVSVYDEFGGRGRDPLDQGLDACPGLTIPAVPYSDTGTTMGRTNNYSGSCVGGSGRDVIYAFTPPVTQTYRVSLCGSSFDTGLYIRTGGTCPGSTEVACNNNFCGLQSELDALLSAGVQYYIVVDGGSVSAFGNYALSMTAVLPGDRCENALVVDSLPFLVCSSTVGFGNDYTPPAACLSGIHSAPDAVYRFTPTADTVISAALCRSEFNTVLAVWDGCPGGPGTLVACSDDGIDCAPGSRIPSLPLSGQHDYYFVIDGQGSASGNYSFSLGQGDVYSSAVVPCNLQCPPGATPEGESCPTTNPDTYNGGWWVSTYPSTPISCGQTICGTSFWDATTRDHDFYDFSIARRESIRVCITAEFDFSLQIIELDYGCGLATGPGGIVGTACTESCYSICLNASDDVPGWMIHIAPIGPTNGIPCGSGDYVLSLNCVPCSRCIECQPGDISENEPCSNTPDHLNGGCVNSTPYAMQLQCNDVVCGTFSDPQIQPAYVGNIDYYELITTQHDSVVFCATSKFGAAIAIIEPFSVASCVPFDVITWAEGVAGACDTARCARCLSAGTYWLKVEHISNNLLCPDDPYRAWVQCFPCAPCAPCPPHAVHENERCPLGSINNGCTDWPIYTTPVQCGDDVCGTAWAVGFEEYGGADYDYYELTLMRNDTVHWVVTADFDFEAGIFAPSASCPPPVVYASGNALACQTLDLSACLLPGVYWLGINPTAIIPLTQCKPYVAHVSCVPCLVDSCVHAWADDELTNNSCPPGDSLATTPCDTLCGEIDPVGDVDWYYFNVGGPGCRELTIDVYGNDTPGWFSSGKGLDSKVTVYHADCSTIAAANNDVNPPVNRDSYLQVCLQPGDYYLKVEAGSAGSSGPYVLKVRCDPCSCSAPCPMPSCFTIPIDAQNWWPLDESASPARDVLHHRDAQWMNGPMSSPGVVGNALWFPPGSGSFAQVNNTNGAPINVGTDDFTLDCWFQFDHYPIPSQTIAGKEGLSGGFQLYIGSQWLQGRISHPLLPGSPVNVMFIPIIPIQPNTWHFAALQYEKDPSGTSATLSLYWNGTPGPVASTNLALPVGGLNLTNSTPFCIGNSFVGYDPLDGAVDEVELFRRALSDDEIAAIYNSAPIGKCKEFCHLPWDQTFCAGSNTITVYVTLCNSTGTQKCYNIGASGVLPYTWQCPFAAPTQFSYPNGTGPFCIGPAASCVSIPIVITKPAGLGTGPNDVSCYAVSVTDPATGDTLFCCHGSIWGREKWCPCGSLAWTGPAIFDIPVARDTLIPIPIVNEADSSGVFNYWLDVMGPDSTRPRYRLNGLSPGVPVTGSMNIPLGQTDTLEVAVQFTSPQPLHICDLMLGWDRNGDGQPEYSFSLGMRSLDETESLPPSEVTNLVIKKRAPCHKELYWSPVDGATGYAVYSAGDVATDPSSWILEWTTSDTTFTDSTDGLRKFYFVKATD